jgi:malate synthase
MSVLGVEIRGDSPPVYSQILTTDALSFLAKLHRAFNAHRLALLAERDRKQKLWDNGRWPEFRTDTVQIRDRDWQVAPAPADLQKRWVEITGPTDRKMIINALNSGADVFMADFEDANSPTWANMVEGQQNLVDTVRREIEFTNPAGKRYTLNTETATLFVRPRGWHLEEKHLLVDGEPISASLFDFGLYFFHNARALLARQTGPYFYLAKLEGYEEAQLWNDAFVLAQEELGIPVGTIKATVLIENILAAFEMEEILYALRDHSAGLNAGRWDYIFSVIRKFRNRPDVLLPNRALITMTVPFMRAYSELLVKSCHKRGAHAIGGMAAYIPRKDPEANQEAFAKVRADKLRESGDGYDGTWVAHPGLVPFVHDIFANEMGDQDHQVSRRRDDVQVAGPDLVNLAIAGGTINEAGLRLNVNVSLLYLASWLEGTGAAALYNLMEDTATAEISRAQLWQWIHHDRACLEDGREITAGLVTRMIPEELTAIRDMLGENQYAAYPFATAAEILTDLVAADEFVEFLTLNAYAYLN